MLTSHIMTAAEKTFCEVISLNLRVIVVLEEDSENERKCDITQVHVNVIVLKR